MSLAMKRVKHQTEGIEWANKTVDPEVDDYDMAGVPTVDNAGKFFKSTPVSLTGDFGVQPVKKKLNVEIK